MSLQKKRLWGRKRDSFQFGCKYDLSFMAPVWMWRCKQCKQRRVRCRSLANSDRWQTRCMNVIDWLRLWISVITTTSVLDQSIFCGFLPSLWAIFSLFKHVWIHFMGLAFPTNQSLSVKYWLKIKKTPYLELPGISVTVRRYFMSSVLPPPFFSCDGNRVPAHSFTQLFNQDAS